MLQALWLIPASQVRDDCFFSPPRHAVCIFYLVLRALDTVEDDMSIPLDVKVPMLHEFHSHLYQPDWKYTESKEKDRQVLEDFPTVRQPPPCSLWHLWVPSRVHVVSAQLVQSYSFSPSPACGAGCQAGVRIPNIVQCCEPEGIWLGESASPGKWLYFSSAGRTDDHCLVESFGFVTQHSA